MPVAFLTDDEREQLQGFPEQMSQDDLTAFFTLSPTDMALVRKQRGAHNRLGFSLQLCSLRYLGLALNDIRTAPDMVIAYLSKQLSVDPSCLELYGERMQTQSDHLQEAQRYLGFHTASKSELYDISRWLLERALEHDKPSLLIQLLREKLYQERIIRPGISRFERLVAAARAKAQGEIHKRLSPLLTPANTTLLDGLLDSQGASHRTQLTWLGKGATSNSASAMLAALEKLAFLRDQQVDTWDISALTPNRLQFLAQIAKRSTNQAMQRMPEERRYPILLAFLYQSLINITDETIEIYDRCLWDCYNGAKNDLEAFKKEVYKSANEKVSMLKGIGQLVLDPSVADKALRTSIFAYLPQEKLESVIDECTRIIRPANDKYFDFLASRYSYLRQFVPKFLSSFVFQSNIKDDPLLEALELLRQLNATKQRKLPDSVPLDFLTDDWLRYVLNADNSINRRYYEVSVLWELRSNLRAGNIWVAHSRRYANPETYLIPKEQWQELRAEVCSQMHVEESGLTRLQARSKELAELSRSADAFLAGSGRGEVRIEQGKLVVPRLHEEELPESAKQLQALITRRLPRVDLTDLLLEVGSWTDFPEHFEHAGGSQPRTSERLVYLHASVLAQACNFGLHQMANIAKLSYDKLAWYTRWYIREETLKKAFTAIVNKQSHQWLSQSWGDGSFSSSDGQRFLTVGKNRLATTLPRYFGYKQGITFYTWTSSQYSQFGTKPTRTTARDATYVLDEILGNESELPLVNPTTDTAGFTEVDFALFSLLGRGYWPRLRDIGDQHLYRMEGSERYPHLEPLLKTTINEHLIMNNYDEILRVAGSMQVGFVTASLFISKLQARPQQNILTRVLQEYGKLEKTIFILRYIQDPVFRREINLQLNKGEQLHDLRQFLHFANEGKIRTHLEEEQINEASCLNLVTNAIVLWNTVYMQAIVEQLRTEGYQIDDNDLRHLGPARFEHINPYGQYTFHVRQELERKGLRPLRKP
ncbi:MAG TPA: Tn3 family transposase [Ktedonobacteraceae bacterium]|nr:Tn3 family transposase [Ktedonobacteraceae bacterium]